MKTFDKFHLYLHSAPEGSFKSKKYDFSIFTPKSVFNSLKFIKNVSE